MTGATIKVIMKSKIEQKAGIKDCYLLQGNFVPLLGWLASLASPDRLCGQDEAISGGLEIYSLLVHEARVFAGVDVAKIASLSAEDNSISLDEERVAVSNQMPQEIRRSHLLFCVFGKYWINACVGKIQIIR